MPSCKVSGPSSSSLRRPSAADGDARSRVSSSGCVPGRWIFSGFIICGSCQSLCAKEMLMIRGYAGFVGGDGWQASGRRRCLLEGSSSTGSMNFSVFFVLLRGLSAKWSGQLSLFLFICTCICTLFLNQKYRCVLLKKYPQKKRAVNIVTTRWGGGLVCSK